MKKLLVAAVILFGLGTAANAMDLNGKLEVGVGSFYGIPTSSDFNDVVDNAFAWTLFADYKVLNNVSVGLEYAQSFGYDISENGDGPDSIDENYFGIRGKYLLPFDIGNMKANAYGLVGIARYKWETDPDYVDDDGIGFSLGLGFFFLSFLRAAVIIFSCSGGLISNIKARNIDFPKAATLRGGRKYRCGKGQRGPGLP